MAIIGSLFLILCSKINFTIFLVPFTLQTFGVMVLAGLLSPRLATASVLLYITEGLIGLPVFANAPYKGASFVYLLGPTGGYILGFLVAAIVISVLMSKIQKQNIVKTYSVMILGTSVIYLFGILWLTKFMTFEKAISVGLLPFVYPEMLKIFFAGGIIKIYQKLQK
jgi:biotin transport system substrate-specific component